MPEKVFAHPDPFVGFGIFHGAARRTSRMRSLPWPCQQLQSSSWPLHQNARGFRPLQSLRSRWIVCPPNEVDLEGGNIGRHFCKSTTGIFEASSVISSRSRATGSITSSSSYTSSSMYCKSFSLLNGFYQSFQFAFRIPEPVWYSIRGRYANRWLPIPAGAGGHDRGPNGLHGKQRHRIQCRVYICRDWFHP